MLPELISVILGLIAAAVVAELGVRWWMRTFGGYFVWKPNTKVRMHLDQEALPEMEPEVSLRVNRNGERGDDPPPAHDDPSVYRVLVAGGSAAECYFLDQDTQWAGALQARLNTPERLNSLGKHSAYVSNIGRSGVGATSVIARTLGLIEDRLPRLDALVIMAGAADMVNWMRLGTPNPIPDEFTLNHLFLQHPKKPFGWKPKQTALFEVLRRMKMRHSSAEMVRQRAGKKLTEVRAMRRAAQQILTEIPDPTPMIDQYEEGLRAAITAGKRVADRVILFRQPWFEKAEYSPEEIAHFWNMGRGNPYAKPLDTYYDFHLSADLMGQLSARGAAICDEMDAEHIDLMPILESSLANYYDFFHFTPKGAATVADVLEATLLLEKPVATAS